MTTAAARTGAVPRRYRSPLRAQRAAETRDALLAVAHRSFVTHGWAGTAMRDVAGKGGVAIETLYSHFPSKRVLLQAVIDIAVVGDDLPVPVAQRPEFVAMGKGTHRERTAAAARLLTGVHQRTAGFAKVLREAATTDAEIAETLRATRERQRLDVAAAGELIMGRAPADAERDGVWAVTGPEVYLLLVEETGWTPEQYEAWMAETLERLVAPATKRRRA
jgi:AcrR family transcriptional regulator